MELTLIWDLLIYADVKGHNNSRFIFLAYYRLSPSDFLSSLYSVAGTLCNIRNELLIIGDLNFKVGGRGVEEVGVLVKPYCCLFILEGFLQIKPLIGFIQ